MAHADYSSSCWCTTACVCAEEVGPTSIPKPEAAVTYLRDDYLEQEAVRKALNSTIFSRSCSKAFDNDFSWNNDGSSVEPWQSDSDAYSSVRTSEAEDSLSAPKAYNQLEENGELLKGIYYDWRDPNRTFVQASRKPRRRLEYGWNSSTRQDEVKIDSIAMDVESALCAQLEGVNLSQDEEKSNRSLLRGRKRNSARCTIIVEDDWNFESDNLIHGNLSYDDGLPYEKYSLFDGD